jgi:hypothetical protein
MALGFTFTLELADGTPTDPPTFRTSVLNATGRHDSAGARTLRVVALRDDDADQPPVLVVQDVAERASSDAA